MSGDGGRAPKERDVGRDILTAVVMLVFGAFTLQSESTASTVVGIALLIAGAYFLLVAAIATGTRRG